MLNSTKASQKAVFLDCCFSGAFTARHRFTGGVRQEPRRLKRERGTFMLQSSSHQKASKAQGPDRPSVFTEVLLNGLRGGAQATDEDGWITANDLARYAMSEMSRRQQDKPVESSEASPIRFDWWRDPRRSHRGRRIRVRRSRTTHRSTTTGGEGCSPTTPTAATLGRSAVLRRSGPAGLVPRGTRWR